MKARFNLDAFVEILDRSNYSSRTDFAKCAGISPGTLHDITTRDPDTGRPRRNPSVDLIRRLAAGLKVPLPALLTEPLDAEALVRPIAYQHHVGPTMPEVWVLALNRYQRDNLLLLLNAVGYPGGDNPHADPALARYNTGDWLGELVQKLMKVEYGNHEKKISMVVDENDSPNAVHVVRPEPPEIQFDPGPLSPLAGGPMSTHSVVGPVTTEIVDGYPATIAGAGGRTVACVVCGGSGHPRGSWLEAHRDHVLCTCGRSTTRKGHPSHVGAMKRHAEIVERIVSTRHLS